MKKKSKKKKLIKILLGIGATCVGLYVADKYIPGFNKNITKPVKGLANTVASDVKEIFLKEERRQQEKRPQRQPQERRENQPEQRREDRPRRPERKIGRESFRRENRKDNNNTKNQKNF
jgi:hypothetical protein